MKSLALLVGAGILAGCAISQPPVIVQAQPSAVLGAAGQTTVIPPEEYPPVGFCRIWLPGVPAGQQAQPGRCAVLEQQVPAGAILLRR